MKSTASRWIAAASAILAVGAVEAARRPRYGGELRIETRTTAPPILDGQIFETLVRLDDRGEPQPWLATSWVHEPDKKRWVFAARPNVMLHNGAIWSPPGGVVTVPDDRPIEQILRGLARSRNAIVIRGADGTSVGTGPFRIMQWEAGKWAALAAHDGYWGGRPYLDTVRIQMGRELRDQAVDLEVEKADVVEIPVTELRRLRQRGIGVTATVPMETLALVFENGRVPDAVREAVALSIDRTAIYNVLLQKQGEISGALLPKWLSGYSFLFATDRDLTRARQMAASATLSFSYDRQDSVIRAIAERIAVNASEAGISMRPAAGPADVRLALLPIASRDPWTALEDLATLLKAPSPAAATSPYEAERELLAGFRVIPLMQLPDAWAFSSRVKDWPRLADVWLEGKDSQ